MRRIDEVAAAKDFLEKLKGGSYPMERSKNDAVVYSDNKEERDTEAVRASTKSELFQEFKKMK